MSEIRCGTGLTLPSVGEVIVPKPDPCVNNSGGIVRMVCMLDDHVPDSWTVLLNEVALFNVSDRKWLISLNVDISGGLEKART